MRRTEEKEKRDLKKIVQSWWAFWFFFQITKNVLNMNGKIEALTFKTKMNKVCSQYEETFVLGFYFYDKV